ncbi:hypothetical protein [Curtobacterium sp. Leaf261]|uniref:hypothetical protein n=1 Tax=Curtobacterium sp. Leaf261 TaxID=1736311 RepID=UPI0006FB761A|nr:hypothetical protein [Curtobacterium sp. Leaf261]KQO61289.1 MFS transporter permease [Curtobacterium sp. Leaf261]
MSGWSRRRALARRPRARGVWFATGTGLVVAVVLFLVAFLPLVGLLAGITAGTAGLVPFPAGSVIAVTVLGGVIVLALLVLAVTRRHATPAWLASALAMIVTVGVVVFPVVAVAIGSADRAADFWPTVADIWQRITGG